jgi:hypothetical protein
VKRFIAHPPGSQNVETYRQFQELQLVTKQLADEVQRLKAELEAVRNDLGG